MDNGLYQESLFSSLDEQESTQQSFGESRQLNVVEASFICEHKTEWTNLFNGFDEMYVITFSSSIDFMAQLLPKFNTSEIIFGNETVLGNDVSLIMALQAAELKYITSRKSAISLAEMMEKGNLKLFISRDIKSHEKIYILKSNDNKYRVITGSANFSYSAFNGIQRENITYMDGIEAFTYYKKLFDAFKESCSDEIANKAFLAAIQQGPESITENPEFIPISSTAEKNRIVIIEKDEASDDNEYVIAADAKAISEDIKSIMPKANKEGKTLITPKTITDIKRKYNETLTIRKETRSKFPQLHLDFDSNRMLFDDKEMNLSPSPEAIKSDLMYFFKYISGFDAFSGDADKNKRNYFMFAVWYLASPFMAKLRYVASSNGHDILQFPVYAIVYGDSNGGKTEFTQMLTKLMCGKRIPVNGNEDFTKTAIDGLKQSCEGLPIVIDDLDKSHYTNNGSSIIKFDNWGIRQKLLNYPCVAVTTNELPSIKADISKRAYVCYIDARIDKSRSRENYRKIRESVDSLTCSFYGEYVRRMFDAVGDICEQMKGEDRNYLPDIFEASSQTFIDIVREFCGEEVPNYMEVCTYENYFGNKAVGKNAIKRILRAWEMEPTAFEIQKKRNRLIYRIPENGDVYQLRYITQELPPNLNAIVVQRTLTMDLDAAQEFFEVNFRNRHRLFGEKR